MENVAVLYATKTQHSKKLAEAVGSALNVKAQNITDNPNIKDTELLFIVGGIYGGVSLPELLTFVSGMETPALKRAALITNCASGKQRQAALRKILEDKGVQVIDEFVCKGAILFVSLPHPNAKDLKNAVEFAQKIAAQNS
ncbi:MAG: flavodoxin domain-containing protein [Clostridiaceae bacterium]